MPRQHQGKFRFRVQGTTYEIPSLPFGWTHSPSIAVAVLSMYLQNIFPNEVILIQFVDDVLICGQNRHQVEEATNHIVTQLHAAGWLVSPKSIVQAHDIIEWMGKEVDGHHHTIMQSTKYIAHTIALWNILATRGYQAKLMKRIIGKLIWATRPGRAAMPLLARTNGMATLRPRAK